ncbi:phosphate transporter [Chloropicon primus]|uniref:Phosphate transporter n=2 Tax=Chloropicon primus TaxID=1764295 RepID=A0A5B8MMI0_9CHLO|nr:phosphate transporter [Chloropicon primus]UPR01078.1 phosphate transporter [Chloropicon primus]|eukprot:QDZ21858.1 phosphate transporter [Chloropicon primus]
MAQLTTRRMKMKKISLYAVALGLFVVVLSVAAIAVAQESGNGVTETFNVGDRSVTATVTECEVGVYDCENLEFFDYVEEDDPANPTCAPYNDHFVNPSSLKWVVGVGAVVAMVMAYGIGSNDAANSWGTSVGSGAISLRWGCFVGGIMEWAGAVAVGYGVAKTIKGTAKIGDPSCFACGMCNSAMSLYAVAMFSALLAASIFLLLASTTWMPVSTTHAIIGGAVGATWAATAWRCLNWKLDGGLGGIVLSWVASPLLSGMIGSAAYFLTYYTIIKPKLGGNPKRNALIGVPCLYGAQAYVMLFLILMKAPLTKKKYSLNEFAIFAIPAGAALLLGGFLFCWYYVRPRLPSLRPKQVDAEGQVEFDAAKQVAKPAADGDAPEELKSPGKDVVDSLQRHETFDAINELNSPHSGEVYNEDEKDAIYYFKYLLVFVAALESFAHGSNDTGNATGAMSAIIQTFQEGTDACKKPETPVWVMAVAGFFVFLGVNTFGYRVIKTIGTNIVDINFHRGWCVEFASTFTVIIATTISMPVSTTHCQVGGVVAVGLSAFGPKQVKWSLFGRIFATWVLTLPFSGGLAAAFTAALRPAIYGSGR